MALKIPFLKSRLAHGEKVVYKYCRFNPGASKDEQKYEFEDLAADRELTIPHEELTKKGTHTSPKC